MTTLDTAATAEIERLKELVDYLTGEFNVMAHRLEESERQRKQLSEYIEKLGMAGIEAAVGAGK